MTARPLAEFTLEPLAPASARRMRRIAKEEVNAAATRETAEPANPRASTSLSPRRSAARPHGRSVSVDPTHAAASSRPTFASERSNSLRSAGASTGSPVTNVTAEPAAAAVPPARTAQR
jgi:hypothetical protein